MIETSIPEESPTTPSEISLWGESYVFVPKDPNLQAAYDKATSRLWWLTLSKTLIPLHRQILTGEARKAGFHSVHELLNVISAERDSLKKTIPSFAWDVYHLR